MSDRPKTGVQLIAAERRRQVEKEGWNSEHDDEEHESQELAVAAMCYIDTAVSQASGSTAGEAMESVLDENWPRWPWGNDEFKPKGVLQDLVRAGALIAAEIDRIQRLNKALKKWNL